VALVVTTLLLTAPIWAQDQPSPEERLTSWAKAHPETPLQATISFGKAVADQQVRSFVEKHDLGLVAVYTHAEGVHAMSRERTATDVGLIARARGRIVEVAEARVERMPVIARQFLEENPKEKAVSDRQLSGLGRSQLAILENNRAALAAYKANRPIVYAVTVSASVDVLKAAAGDPMAKSFEPGVEVEGGRVAVPDPVPPGGTAELRVPASVGELTPAQVYERLQELGGPAQGGER